MFYVGYLEARVIPGLRVAPLTPPPCPAEKFDSLFFGLATNEEIDVLSQCAS